MFPTLLKIGPLVIHSYGVMIALGFLAGLFLSLYFARKEGLAAEDILSLSLYFLFSGIIGARLFYVVGDWPAYKDNLIDIFMIQKGGLAITGGIIAALLTVVWYAKRKHLPLLKLLDAIAPGLLLGYAIGRLGCFLNGCCFGLPARLPWAIHFPPPSLAHYHFGEALLHPTQLYSSLAGLVAFLLILFLYPRKKFSGQVFFWGLIFYAVYRFTVEFFRYSPFYWLGFTPAQWFAAAAFLFALAGLTTRLFRAKIN